MSDYEAARSEAAAKLSRANAKLDRCRDRGNVRLSDLEMVRNDLAELVGEYGAALDELRALATEYGIDATFASTRSVTFTVADTLGDALKALEEFDAKRRDVACRQLVERPVGEWRKVGDGGAVRCGRQCSEMHTYEPGRCEAAVASAEEEADHA